MEQAENIEVMAKEIKERTIVKQGMNDTKGENKEQL